MKGLTRRRDPVDRPKPTLVLDPTLGDPLVRQAKAAVAAGDDAAVVAMLRSAPDDSRLDFLAASLLVDRTEVPPWLAGWVDREPDDLRARALVGVSLVHRAWTARTPERAELVAAEQFEAFWALLREAEQVLFDVVDADPGAALAWSSLIDCGRGLEIDKVELSKRFLACHAATPLHPPACRAYLQGLCGKWGGSVQDTLNFARWAAVQAPPGHAAHALIAEAHFEATVEDLQASRTPDAVAEVRYALERSGLSEPGWGDEPLGIPLRNLFAITALRLQDREVAAHLISMSGLDPTKVTRFPWSYFGDPAEVYVNTGRSLGLW